MLNLNKVIGKNHGNLEYILFKKILHHSLFFVLWASNTRTCNTQKNYRIKFFLKINPALESLKICIRPVVLREAFKNVPNYVFWAYLSYHVVRLRKKKS